MSLRDEFLKVIDRPRVDIDPVTKASKVEDGLIFEYAQIQSEADYTVPVLLVKVGGGQSEYCLRQAFPCVHACSFHTS